MTFAATIAQGPRVLITWEGRPVVTLTGADARRVADRLERAEGDDATQLVLARATGNFKRGNER